MTTEVQQQTSSRSLFKMNTDFWQQARGPPLAGSHGPNLLINTSTPPIVGDGNTNQTPSSSGATNSSVSSSLGNGNSNNISNSGGGNGTGNSDNNNSGGNSGVVGCPTTGSPVPNMQNSAPNNGNDPNNSNSSILTPTALHHQLQQIHQQHQQHAANSSGMGPGLLTGHLTPNHQLSAGNGPTSVVSMQMQQLQQNHQQMSAAAAAAAAAANIQQQQQHLQQHPPQSLTPGGSSTPDTKFSNEKLVNEIQLQLTRSNSAAAISERTLEECWSTLQRLFMHKSAMQQIQHMPRVGLGAGMSAEVKPHQCQQCLKSFSSNHQLVQHIRVHTGEKPYKCSYCDRRFKQLSHVQQHTRLHTGERPYKCHLPDCGRAFIQLSNLQQHLRNHDAQVERAKNRPFHCNICGKGFATESSLRTHTSKVSHNELGLGMKSFNAVCTAKAVTEHEELQLHLGVLQQHAALIGGPNATTCPICHKLFLGGEALMEHMKHTHKDPNASGVATKRRTANHPCPVCGKHYVNEGSLRKHLACHPETSQLTTSLRMWPCSVCQAVFTHEAGLLTHMEHMRMDPKHQFAAQYVLSRAAAERRERDTLLAAAVAVSASSSNLLSMSAGGASVGDGGANSMCASPSAHSDSSSGNGRVSSTGSDPGGNLLSNNNNNCSSKLSDILRAGNNGHLHQQYSVDDLHANRMSLMAAAIVGPTGAGVPGSLGSPGVDSTTAGAVQAAVVNLAAAMRMGHVASQQNSNNGSSGGGPQTPPPMGNDSASAAAAQAAMNAMRVSMADSMMRSSMIVDPMSHQPHHQHHQQNSPEAALRMHQAEAILRSQAEAALRLAVSVAASNNGSANDVSLNNSLRHHNGAFSHQQQQQQHQQQQHQQNSGSSNNGGGPQGNSNSGPQSQQHPPQSQTPQLQSQQQQQVNPDISEAIRLQEHRLEQALRLHNQHQSHNP